MDSLGKTIVLPVSRLVIYLLQKSLAMKLLSGCLKEQNEGQYRPGFFLRKEEKEKFREAKQENEGFAAGPHKQDGGRGPPLGLHPQPDPAQPELCLLALEHL